ncbi:MAG TPA: FAD-binding and (Fe-S)-binding domain-containing protein [Frankiaceae bacterium]|nr:FAD-binding and (Fe-S)-binding domain-containing protein [Frankiaceae bacterium]
MEKLQRSTSAVVDVSSRRRAEYSTDASNYRVVPQAVVFPRSTDDIVGALAVCRELGAPLTMRGGGTSCAGNAVGPGVVLDTTRYLDRVLSMEPEARTARVQPGVIADDVSRAGSAHGLRFGPDPSTHARCTIGGMIGNNSCGAHTLAYGRTDANVVDLDILTGDGRRMTVGADASQRLAALGLPALDELVSSHLATIRTELGRFSRQVSGYALEHLLPENGGNVARALVGSEGTAALVLGATVRLVESAPATALAVLGYPDMATAAEAVPALLEHSPLALEGLDARLVDVVRRRKGPRAVPVLPRGGGWLMVEMGGATPEEAKAAADRLVEAARDGAVDAKSVAAGPEARSLWRIREDGAGLAGRTPDNQPAWPGWEDSAVPPERLGIYLREFDALMAEHRLDGLAYGHFGDGCIHVRIDFPLAENPRRFRSFLEDAAQLVASHGGSLSGEHGDGRARGELLRYMYSPAALNAFAAFKRAFDPDNVLNPGVLVDPAPVDADLRLPLAAPIRRNLGFAYPHDGGDLSAAVHRCVGVGKCRADTTAGGSFMCPSYLATRDEKDSTRGRSRVLQEMAIGSVVSGGFASPEVHEALDLCLSCKACASDCPAGVDMATYKAEVLHQTYRRKVRPVSHYSLGWLPRWARAASTMPGLANAATRSAPGFAKRLGGVDPRRAIPEFATETFRRWFAGHEAPPEIQQSGDPVMLWVDTFTDYFTPEVGRAAVAVLEDAGYRVQIPRKRVCCGLTWISTGQLDAARRKLRSSVAALNDAAALDIPIVGLEPSCTAVFRSDAPELLPDDGRVRRVAASTRTLAELLDERGWTPPSLEGTSILAQPHCHQHAVMGFEPDEKLLTDAGADLETVAGCCGLAGNFGVELGHYDVSVAVAEHSLLPAIRDASAETEVLADGFSCRTQLNGLADRSGRHLAELLAERLPRR